MSSLAQSKTPLILVIVACCHLAVADESTSLRGHTGLVSSIAFAPDGKLLASAGQDGLVKFWDVATGQERTTFREHAKDVEAIAFTPDGNTLAAGSGKTVKLWNVDRSR